MLHDDRHKNNHDLLVSAWNPELGAKRFESPRPALAGRGRPAKRSEAGRVRGSLHELFAGREPLTPPSPRKNGARETRERGSSFSRRKSARVVVRTTLELKRA